MITIRLILARLLDAMAMAAARLADLARPDRSGGPGEER